MLANTEMFATKYNTQNLYALYIYIRENKCISQIIQLFIKLPNFSQHKQLFILSLSLLLF